MLNICPCSCPYETGHDLNKIINFYSVTELYALDEAFLVLQDSRQSSMNDASLEQLLIANGFWSASANSTVSLQICMMCLAFSILSAPTIEQFVSMCKVVCPSSSHAQSGDGHVSLSYL